MQKPRMADFKIYLIEKVKSGANCETHQALGVVNEFLKTPKAVIEFKKSQEVFKRFEKIGKPKTIKSIIETILNDHERGLSVERPKL